MTDWTAREISVKLDFLPEGKYAAVIYSDAEDADQFPNKLEKEKYIVISKDILKCKMASGGGQTIHLFPIDGPDSELPKYMN
jgi:alpha-glucosidase